MVKDRPKHGYFEDVMSIDTDFSKHLEDVFPAATSQLTMTRSSSSRFVDREIRTRLGSRYRPNHPLQHDARSRFMDANQVGFVHELQWEEIKTMLDNAITIKPRRQMSVQFSGGEPTLSLYFLDAVRYARKSDKLRASRNQRNRIRKKF